MRVFIGAAATGALAIALITASSGPSTAGKPSMHTMSSASGGQVAKGKVLAAKYRCNTCHGANLAGKPGFSPSLRARGVLKEYNPKTWERVLATGVTNDGQKVKPPMPVYKMAKGDADAIWAYLKTQK